MKLYKKYILSSLLVILVSFLSFAQNGKQCLQHREMIKAKRVAFITESLNLSVKDAQAFWPIFNDYSNNLEALRVKKHTQMKNVYLNSKSLTEKEYQGFLNQYIYFIEEETRLKKDYQEKLSKVLSAKQIFLLYKSEKDFKRQLMLDLKKQKPACMD
jgi:hypothetical protein